MLQRTQAELEAERVHGRLVEQQLAKVQQRVEELEAAMAAATGQVDVLADRLEDERSVGTARCHRHFHFALQKIAAISGCG